ncbi:hypothetical protein L9F63_004561, partial [Diploptera punctata]
NITCRKVLLVILDDMSIVLTATNFENVTMSSCGIINYYPRIMHLRIYLANHMCSKYMYKHFPTLFSLSYFLLVFYVFLMSYGVLGSRNIADNLAIYFFLVRSWGSLLAVPSRWIEICSFFIMSDSSFFGK